MADFLDQLWAFRQRQFFAFGWDRFSSRAKVCAASTAFLFRVRRPGDLSGKIDLAQNPDAALVEGLPCPCQFYPPGRADE